MVNQIGSQCSSGRRRKEVCHTEDFWKPAIVQHLFQAVCVALYA